MLQDLVIPTEGRNLLQDLVIPTKGRNLLQDLVIPTEGRNLLLLRAAGAAGCTTERHFGLIRFYRGSLKFTVTCV